LGVAEVAAEDLLRRLELPVDSAVALLEPGRVPGQVEMHEVEAANLQVDAFAGGIGADQDAQRLLCRVGVEGLLDRLAAVAAGRTRKDANALDQPVGAGQALAQPLLQPAAGGADDPILASPLYRPNPNAH